MSPWEITSYLPSKGFKLIFTCLQLNPSASEALKRMHMLAADPGIVAIMNKVLLNAASGVNNHINSIRSDYSSFLCVKHHWRVGIMTELAPVGYVGISPKCILGFNKVTSILRIQQAALYHVILQTCLLFSFAESWRGNISASSN